VKHKTPEGTKNLTPNGKRIVYAPAPPAKPKKKQGISAVQADGGKPSGQRCPLCGEKTKVGELAKHRCAGLAATVRVRKL